MDVGLRELREHLDELVERAARGETIRITSGGEPRAVLGPASREDRIAEGVREGWITPPSSSEPPALHRKRFRATATLEQILADDRGCE